MCSVSFVLIELVIGFDGTGEYRIYATIGKDLRKMFSVVYSDWYVP